METKSLPLTYALRYAYPNPFNPTTTIRFELPEPKKVSIKIYNVLGQLVETVVNESYPAGKFEKQWNAKRFASGIYFVQMRAGNFIKTTKVTLLK